jgi:hypothetical protein
MSFGAKSINDMHRVICGATYYSNKPTDTKDIQDIFISKVFMFEPF